MQPFTVTRFLPDEASTLALGAELSLCARPQDLILLAGDLGAGKTCLARGFIRAVMNAPEEEVPSPSFPLLQIYDEGRMKLAHFDLYRIADPAEVIELGFDDLLSDHAVLVEWPAMLGEKLPEDRLLVAIESHADGRRARLEAYGSWGTRLERLEALRQFLTGTEWAGAERRFFEGDASTRRYERIRLGSRRAIIMDMPRRPDGPPVRRGLPYSAIAHLAEDIRAVVALNTGLRARGFSAPEIFAGDLDRGFLIIEDLGDLVYGRMTKDRKPLSEPMAAATKLLADMAARDWPNEIALPEGGVYRLADYDREALEIEAELLLDWFWPLAYGGSVSDGVRETFLSAWRGLWPKVDPTRPVWTLRDYHSPNLIWMPERHDTACVGLIDTQDAVMGHPAYDLASLLQDARILVPEDVANDLLDYYCAYRASAEADFDETAFREAFLILSTQRITKIMGIFARLSKRDGKHHYLRHIGKLNRYLETNLRGSVLADLRQWYAEHLPLSIRHKIWTEAA
jgi:tRNA threonylcarbamoyl adenosine modification protein YjeE